jgi:hypothetical protein
VVCDRSELHMTRLGFCVTCPQEFCQRLPATVSVTFSGLADVIQSGEGRQFFVSDDWLDNDAAVCTVVSTDPGTLLDADKVTEGPASGIRWLPGGGTGWALLGRSEPTIRRVVNHTGNGATFEATLVEDEDRDGIPFWKVSAISISGDGYGYTHNSQMIVLLDDGMTCRSVANARLRVARGRPTLDWYVTVDPCSCSTPGAKVGSGAQLQIQYAQASSAVGSETWTVSGVTILNGGYGYTNGSRLVFTAGNGDVLSSAPVATLVVTSGVITGVAMTSGGSAYKQGVPQLVQVVSGGSYFKEDPSLAPYVSPGTKVGPISGDPLDTPTFIVTVDEDPASETFGHVTQLEMTDGGDGHTAWEERKTCASELNGVTLTLQTGAIENPESNPNPSFIDSVELCVQSSFGSPGRLRPVIPATYDGLESGIAEVQGVSGGSLLAVRRRVEPTVTISGGFGQGGTFVVSWVEASFLGLPLWQIAGVTAYGGSGYLDFASLLVTPATSSDKEASPATLRVYRKRIPPEVQASTPCHNGGATFAVNWRQDDSTTPPTLAIEAVSVLSGGSGYSGEVPVRFTVQSGSTQVRAACVVAYTNDRGQLFEASVIDGGSYFRTTSEAGTVAVEDGGYYYRETDSIDVADVTVEVKNLPPSNGSGAAIRAIIDDDPDSATFGTMTAVVDSAGSGYILQRHASTILRDQCPETPFPAFLSILPIRCELDFPRVCFPRLRVWFGASINDPSTPVLVFQADRENAVAFSNSTRSITLTPLLPGNSGQAIVEWGGDFDLGERICSCCDLSVERCVDPPDSGWPLGEGENPAAYVDPLGLVFLGDCQGLDADGNFLANNGGPILYTAVYDANGDFVSWQLMCGECDAAILVGLDQNGDPVYTTTPEPTAIVTESGNKGKTACACFPFDQEQRCLWEPEIGNDGCWTGQYVIADIPCENPLP